MNFYKFQLYEIYSLDSYVKGSSVTLRTLKRVAWLLSWKSS